MIKINLLGSGGGSGGGGGATTYQTRSSVFSNMTQTLMSPAQGTGTGDVILKLIVAIGPLIACIGAEQWMVGNKQQELTRIQNELASKQAEIEAKKKDVEQVKRFKADKAQLELRMNTIRDLSKARLKNVKALDAIQNVIPTRAWMTSLKVQDNKVDIKGRAMEDSDVSAFMKGLEENIYFSQVQLINSQSVTTENGVLKEFSIATSLENL